MSSWNLYAGMDLSQFVNVNLVLEKQVNYCCPSAERSSNVRRNDEISAWWRMNYCHGNNGIFYFLFKYNVMKYNLCSVTLRLFRDWYCVTMLILYPAETRSKSRYTKLAFSTLSRSSISCITWKDENCVIKQPLFLFLLWLYDSEKWSMAVQKMDNVLNMEGKSCIQFKNLTTE